MKNKGKQMEFLLLCNFTVFVYWFGYFHCKIINIIHELLHPIKHTPHCPYLQSYLSK